MQNQQSPHWVDKVVNGVLKWQKKYSVDKLHVDDMKTPSGRVHVGALRGVVLHDVVAKALELKTKQKITSTYVFNNMDPMDGMPTYLDEKEYDQHMGQPLFQIPAPPLEKSGINFAKFYAQDFIDAFRLLGCKQEVIWSDQLYESGQMDEVIKTALDNADTLRKIYKEVAEYDLPANWHPFQVVCPKCNKVGTTLVTGWNGEQVSFECQPNKVEWAKGCGHKGKISPFGGTGKLLWKVDWPAHWAVMGVTIEGSGKDHTSAGGSRDMANAMCEQVFKITVPFDIPYEWLLLRGAKMSSSKGVGTSAREFVNLFPPEIARFLFVNKHYNKVIDFDPRTMAIPNLFDEYDSGARVFWKQEKGDQRLGRSFELAQIKETPKPHFLPRFRDVAIWMQYPELDLIKKFESVKGSKLTKLELKFLEQRTQYAQIWLDKYASDDYMFSFKIELPEVAKELSSDQKEFLQKVNNLINSKNNWDPQNLQQGIYDIAKDSLGVKQGFQAIYLAFLGKTNGPRAGHLLLSIDKKLRNQRVSELK